VSTERADVFVIGGGGTGSDVTTGLLNAGGLSVAMAERDRLGGECAHYGCDPTKAMLKAAKLAAWARKADAYGIRVPTVEVDFPAVMDRVRRLIDEETSQGERPYTDRGARVFMQEARLVEERRAELADGTAFEAERVVLTTGTAASAPPIEGLGGRPRPEGWWSNREAIWTDRLPSSLLILGTGPIGLEFGQIFARFGVPVTMVELFDRILIAEDADAAAALRPALEGDGIRFVVGARTKRAEHDEDGWTLTLDDGQSFSAQRLLVAAGRHPVFDVHDLPAAGVQLDGAGKPVLGETLRTTNPSIWAAGDATGELLFTHVGGYEAGIVVDDIRGRPRSRDYRVVPRVTFTEPEVASVGLTEEQAWQAGHEVKVGMTRFRDSTRAFIEGEQEGVVKLVGDATTGEVLGGHVVGENAGELIHQVVAVMAARTPAEAVADAIHAYPTWSQSLRTAWLDLVR
jgi:pyruvate/2-oxoglutarate dehydrogenase complex dihydrolipoamide dehydrogenase (E3) component